MRLTIVSAHPISAEEELHRRSEIADFGDDASGVVVARAMRESLSGTAKGGDASLGQLGEHLSLAVSLAREAAQLAVLPATAAEHRQGDRFIVALRDIRIPVDDGGQLAISDTGEGERLTS